MRTTRIPNGQVPIISETGDYIYFGNWQVGVLERATGQWDWRCEGWPAGELSPGILGITSSQNVDNPQWRRFYTLDVAGRTPRTEVPIPQSTVPSHAALGHIYGWAPSPSGWTYFRDGQVIPLASSDPLYGFETDGRVLKAGVQAGLSPDRLFDCATGQLVREVSLDGLDVTWQYQRFSRLCVGPDGHYVMQNAANGVWINTPQNQNVKVPQIIPSGEGRGDLVWWQGVCYAVTLTSISETDYLVLVRPADGRWGGQALCVPMHANKLTAKVTAQGELILAGMHAGTNELMVVDDLWMDRLTLENPLTYLPPAPALEPLPALIVRETRPRWIVDTSGVLSGNGISTTAHREAKLFEDALWVTPEDEARLECLYFGPEPPRTGTRDEYFAVTRDMSLRNRVPVFVNDEFGAETQAWRDKFPSECRAFIGLELYRSASESREAFTERTRQRLSAASRPYGIVRPVYQQMAGGSELEAAHTNLIIDACLAEQAEPPILEDVFGLDRNPRSSWRQQYVSTLISFTPPPIMRLRSPAPPVTPPAVPRPTPIDQTGKGQASALKAIGGAVAAFVTLFSWFKRRKK